MGDVISTRAVLRMSSTSLSRGMRNARRDAGARTHWLATQAEVLLVAPRESAVLLADQVLLDMVLTLDLSVPVHMDPGVEFTAEVVEYLCRD